MNNSNQNQATKQNQKNGEKIAAAVIGLPLLMMLFLPARVSSDWQVNVFEFITQKLHISVGLNGPLPFFSVVVSAYLGLVAIVLTGWVLMRALKRWGMGKEFQRMCYRFIEENALDTKYTRWLKRFPLLLKIYLLVLIFLLIMLSVIHLFDADISIKSDRHYGRRRGQLVALSYQYRIGVIIWEMIFHLMTVASSAILFLFCLYVFNILRGLGRGLPPSDQNPQPPV